MTSINELLRGELIGLHARVVMSSHLPLVGMEGKIVDETKNLLILRTPRGDKKIPKSTSVFLITSAGGNEVKVDGIKILGRPEDRIKKRR